MLKNRLLTSLLLSLLVWIPSSVLATPQVFDAAGTPEFITEGQSILSIDYIGVWDNRVTESGTDYPLARIWLVLYQPGRYEKVDEMNEDDWVRSDEIMRVMIQGPSSDGKWANDDEMVYKNLGVHEWGAGAKDRVVFRFMVDRPSEDWETDTLMWGIAREAETQDATSYELPEMTVIFRTLDLPETAAPPVVTFNDVWFVHDVKKDGRLGLEAHVDFQVDNLRASLCRLAGFVHSNADGSQVPTPVEAPEYRTAEGFLTVQEDFVPVYTYTSFSDYTLFIPYDAFPVSADFVSYYVVVQVLDSDLKQLGSTNSVVFEVKRPE